MADAKIKKEYKQTTVAFGSSGLPLGLRPQSDINQLAVIAQESNDQRLLNYFEKPLPSLADLKKSKVDEELQTIRAAVSTVADAKAE